MDVNAILVFVKVAHAGSFSKAAELLKMPVSTVSRRVAELEASLGATLLVRTTRSLKITELGKAYLAHGQAIAAEIEKAESLASHLKSVPQGTLKITATAEFGHRFLGPIVDAFLEAHPHVQADIELTDRVVDLIEEGFDLAIRIGELGDSALMARKIGSIDLQLFAAPGYLKKQGEPKSYDDLKKFDCIRFTGEDDSDHWRLVGPGGEKTVRVSGRISSNDMELVREFALQGKGIALLPHFLCAEDLQAGRLKLVLKNWAHLSGPIHVVYPSQRFVLPRVRVFLDHLVRECAQVRWRH